MCRTREGARKARKETSGFLIKKDEVNAVLRGKGSCTARAGDARAAVARAGVRSLR